MLNRSDISRGRGEPRSAVFATPTADAQLQYVITEYFIPELAKITGRDLGFHFDDLKINPLEISARLAITIWSINPRRIPTRPPGWSGRTNHSPGRNLTRLGRAGER